MAAVIVDVRLLAHALTVDEAGRSHRCAAGLNGSWGQLEWLNKLKG
jgi:hypothetical protein